ncbi:MAG TPA: AraC family transcriptional regulator [Chryseolinea sp.]|nr:AraC family transcriptional regulator [Chryseolinea sp.]
MNDIQYHIIKPPAELSDVVRFFWTFEGVASAEQPYILRTVANGCPEFLFHYQGNFEELVHDSKTATSFSTGIHGQSDLYRRFIVKEPFGIFGVYLYPFAMTSIFGIPAIEFTNQLPDLEWVVGRKDNGITDSMLTARDNQQRLKLITDYLLRRKQSPKQKEIAFAVQQVIHHHGAVDIQALSDQCFRSHRQFERNFKEQTGFTAKKFSRIIRFNSLMHTRKNAHASLTQIALDFGYYDQSHFIHDFKSFSGYSPGTYFSGKANELM